jgi:hypothetical protein
MFRGSHTDRGYDKANQAPDARALRRSLSASSHTDRGYDNETMSVVANDNGEQIVDAAWLSLKATQLVA